jgi:transporter family-2 protein
MHPTLALFVMTLAGAVVAFQAPINGRLGSQIGGIPATAVSFTVGTSVLVLLVLVTGDAGRLSGITDIGVEYLLGGVIGVVYVLSCLLAVRIIGAGGLSAGLITGQLAAAVLLVDRLGVLGVEPTPVTAERVAGVILLAAGAFAVLSRR